MSEILCMLLIGSLGNANQNRSSVNCSICIVTSRQGRRDGKGSKGESHCREISHASRIYLPSVFQADMQSWEEQSQGAIYTVEYACSAIKNMKDSSVYFKSIEGLLRHAIAVKDQLNSTRR
ncbi:hypothetical protein lerEdw1_008507 [Lerista edwardsae]|nr:hypothetical protein lerEdw1_008507 [Lerista edwardsae]